MVFNSGFKGLMQSIITMVFGVEVGHVGDV